MIENIEGIHEEIRFKKNTGVKLHINDENDDYPAHWHSAAEFVMPIEGQYFVECNGQRYVIKEKEVLIICPGSIHKMIHLGDGLRLFLQADCSLFYDIKQVRDFFLRASPAVLITAERFGQKHKNIYHRMISMLDAYVFREETKNVPVREFCHEANSNAGGEAWVYAQILSLIDDLGNSDLIAQAQRNQYKKSFNRYHHANILSIMNYIEKHCSELITLQEMANIAGFSKYHFERVFKQHAGVSFYQFVSNSRIKRAESELMNPDLTITQACFRSGFANTVSFTRMFKKINQCTPKEFRKLHNLL